MVGSGDAINLTPMRANGLIEIIAAQRGIAVGGKHFEDTLGQTQNRNIESATAQIVNREGAFARVVEPIGDGCRSRLIQQSQHVDAGQTGGILGRLTLCVVEVGGDGDHCADQLTVKGLLSQFTQMSENFR